MEDVETNPHTRRGKGSWQKRERVENWRAKKKGNQEGIQKTAGGIWCWWCHGTQRMVEHCHTVNVEDRGVLLKEDGNLLREYQAMREEYFLSNWLREDVEGKDEERENKNKEAKKKRKVKVGRETWMEKGLGFRLTVKGYVWIVCLAPLCVVKFSRSSPILRWRVFGILGAFRCVCLLRFLLWLLFSRMWMWCVRLLSLIRIVKLLSRRPSLLLLCCVFLGSLLCVGVLVSNPQPPHRSGHGCTVGFDRDPPVWWPTQTGWWAIRAPALACVFACAVVVVVVTDCGS